MYTLVEYPIVIFQIYMIYDKMDGNVENVQLYN